MAVSTIDPNGLNIGQIGGTRNKIINGGMVIDQRNAGTAITTSGYPTDRFAVVNSTDGAFSAQQVSEAPSGFTKSLKVTTTTADATLTTTQNLNVVQNIEGLNVADLGFGTAAAKTVTLSFWTRSSLTGTFGGALKNNAADRSYPFTYSISSADTWEYKTVTVAGDTSGTWLTTTGKGLQVVFGLGAGPDRSGTAGAWAGANHNSATGAVSLIGTLNATWQITGVQLEVGDTATPFEHRPFAQELWLSQRYFSKSYVYSTAIGATTTKGMVQTDFVENNQGSGYREKYDFQFPVEMRADPSITTYDSAGTSGKVNYYIGTASTANYTITIANLNARCFGGYSDRVTSIGGWACHYTADAEL
jgi:hypothetical protein